VPALKAAAKRSRRDVLLVSIASMAAAVMISLSAPQFGFAY